MNISSSSTPNTSDNLEKAARRLEQGRAWMNNRDYNVLRRLREAERAALPQRKQPANRLCLECGKPFASTWCGNRRCKLCAERNS